MDTENFVAIAEPEGVHVVELDVGLFRYSHAIQVGPRDTVEVLHVKTFVARVEEYYGVPLVYTGRVN